jgi:hypothetical protein
MARSGTQKRVSQMRPMRTPSATACALVIVPRVNWMSWMSVLTVRSESCSFRAIARVFAPVARSFRTSMLRGSRIWPSRRLRLAASTCRPAAAAPNARHELLAGQALVRQRRHHGQRRVTPRPTSPSDSFKRARSVRWNRRAPANISASWGHRRRGVRVARRGCDPQRPVSVR